MLATVAIVLVASAAAPPAGETFEFVGFSGNEQLAAWRVEVVEERDDGARDRYGLFLLVDAVTSELLHVYRGHEPVRVSPGGKRVPVRGGRLLADNPRYEQASPASEWRRLRSKTRFSFRTLGMEDSTLRLDPDRDARIEATATKTEIDVTGAPGSPVGYHAVLRRFDGALLDFGHYRVDAGATDRVEAVVQVYHSRSGYEVAILNGFRTVSAGGEVRHTSLARVARLHKAPVATMLIGRFNSVATQLEEAERLFKRVHPDQAAQYDDFVRTHW